MRIALPCFLALVLASVPALQAQQAPAADKPPIQVAQNQRRPVPVATPLPREEPKKKGMLQRLFGGREKPAATPAPQPIAQPEKATPTPRPKRRPATARQTKPAAEEKEKPAAEETEKPESAPAVAKKTTKPKSAKAAAKKGDDEKEDEESAPEEKLTAEQQAVKDAEAAGNAIAIEKAKYDEVKSRAIQDEKIVALKEKADAVTDEEEGRKALRAYNKALFQKMRTMDGSIRERVDLMEDAVMKRLEGTTAAKN